MGENRASVPPGKIIQPANLAADLKSRSHKNITIHHDPEIHTERTCRVTSVRDRSRSSAQPNLHWDTTS